MNTKIIIYDDSCPLCAAYTNVFIQTGLIEKEGRKNFSNIAPELLQQIDPKKSVNEIPVIDTATKQVWYGIDALLEILQQKIPFAKKLGNIKAIKWLLKKAYKFISYNRRVIVAANNKPGTFDCTPDFNIRYRTVFIIIFLLAGSGILFGLQQHVLNNSIFRNNNFWQLQLAYATMVLLNTIIVIKLNTKDVLEYLGQLTMLVLVTTLLTTPLIALNNYFPQITSNSNNFYLGMLAIFAAKEYKRRMQFIGFLQGHPAIIFINAFIVTAFFIYLIL